MGLNLSSGTIMDRAYIAAIRVQNGEAWLRGGDVPGLAISFEPDGEPSLSRDMPALAPQGRLGRASNVSSRSVLIRIAPGFRFEKPVLLEFAARTDGLEDIQRLSVSLGAGAEASICVFRVDSLDGRDRADTATATATVELGASSSLGLFELVEPGFRPEYHDGVRCALDSGSSLEWCRGFLGGSGASSSIIVDLKGEGARINVVQAYAAAAGRTVDLSATQRHSGKLSYSRTRFAGVAGGDGKASAKGLIEVDRQASGTDAYLHSSALTLSPEARVMSFPELRIDTNDLTASHGSTVGSIGLDELFYLESRGISPSRARAAVAEGMLAVLHERAPEQVRDRVAEFIEASLASISSVPDGFSAV